MSVCPHSPAMSLSLVYTLIYVHTCTLSLHTGAAISDARAGFVFRDPDTVGPESLLNREAGAEVTCPPGPGCGGCGGQWLGLPVGAGHKGPHSALLPQLHPCGELSSGRGWKDIGQSFLAASLCGMAYSVCPGINQAWRATREWSAFCSRGPQSLISSGLVHY